mgnify:CR=1 FL=1
MKWVPNIFSATSRMPQITALGCIALLLSACAQQPIPQQKTEFEPVPEFSSLALSRFQCHPPAGLIKTQRGDHTLYTAEDVSFTPFDRLYINNTAWHWSQAAYSASRVSEEQLRQLHRVVEQSISSEWRQRFAWIPTDTRGTNTLSLQVWVSDFDPAEESLSHSITVSARLIDSEKGQALLQVCDSKLTLTAQGIAKPERSLERDSRLSQRLTEALTRWASAIGSHIAAQP